MNTRRPPDDVLRLIGDVMHHAAYYESAKTGERKAAAYQRMQDACRTALMAILNRDATDDEVEYLLRRGQCHTHGEATPTEPHSVERCDKCEASLPDGQSYWCLSLQNETCEYDSVSVHDAQWLRKWCETCAATLWFDNVIVPTKTD